MEAVCGARHPLLSVADASHRAESPETQDTLTFSRPPMSGDGELPGFWPVLNSIFQCGSETFPIEAQCCGVPGKQGGEEVESLEATIEVFPDDQYSLSLEIPALLKPDSLTYETKTSGWETEKDRKEKQVDEAGEEASDLYKSSQDLQDIGSEGEFKQFAEDLTKKQLQIEDETWSDQLSVKLTQTDGARTYEAPVDDLIRLVKMILSPRNTPSSRFRTGWITSRWGRGYNSTSTFSSSPAQSKRTGATPSFWTIASSSHTAAPSSWCWSKRS